MKGQKRAGAGVYFLYQTDQDRNIFPSERVSLPFPGSQHLHMIGPFKIAVVVADMSALFMETSIVYCYEPIYQRQETGLCK